MKIQPTNRPPLCAPVLIVPGAPSKVRLPKAGFVHRSGPVAHWAYLERINRERPAPRPTWPAFTLPPARQQTPPEPARSSAPRLGDVTPVAPRAAITSGRVRIVREPVTRPGRTDLII